MANAFQQKFDPAIWRVVEQISPGSVLSYGQVAALAGYPRHARMVSKAMSRCPQALPWHRVVSANLKLAFAPGSKQYAKQAGLLREEGVSFSNGRLQPVEQSLDNKEDLDLQLWGPVPD